MRLLPRSPRLRRRLLPVAALAACLGVFGILAVVFRHSERPLPTLNAPPQLYHPPKVVRATPAERRAALETLRTFVESAVIRRHLERSWPLASPRMREGVSHYDWLSGNLPVVPYPAAEFRTASYRLSGQYRRLLDWDVLVLPKRASGDQRVYTCELREVHGRWLVDFCYPRTTL